MFIAPISRRKQFSKAFLSYKKYNKKLQKYLKRKRLMRHTNITKKPKQFSLEKKSHIHPDLGELNKIMDVFDIAHSDENYKSETDFDDCSFVSHFSGLYGEKWTLMHTVFTPPELLDDYFLSVQEDFV
jgi:hypothetical protein